MASLGGSVVVNIGNDIIESFLRGKGLTRTGSDIGKEVEFWVDSLLECGMLSIDEFEKFLRQELFYGKRKLIRVYDFTEYNTQGWINRLKTLYGVVDENYSNILGTGVSSEELLKIASVQSSTNYKGDLQWVDILFVHYAEELTSRSLVQTRSYIPVEIDFITKQVFIKAWNRNGLTEDFRPNVLMDKVYSIIEKVFKFTIASRQLQRKSTLFSMSQGIVREIYSKIPAYNQIKDFDDSISAFEAQIVSNMNLVNISTENLKSDNSNVFDLHDELQKILEKLVVSDYFYSIPYEQVWDLDINAIISRIRFNDVEHVLTSLSGEESEMPIFCTKTFLALKKSMEDAKLVERLWVVSKRKRRMLKYRYDATNEYYLELMVLNNARYKKEDLLFIMEMYNKYVSEQTCRITRLDRQCAC